MGEIQSSSEWVKVYMKVQNVNNLSCYAVLSQQMENVYKTSYKLYHGIIAPAERIKEITCYLTFKV